MTLSALRFARIRRYATSAVALAGLLLARTGWSDDLNGRLDFYFIDVEGGAAMLAVTPAGETVLIDSGYPDYGDRDRDRILNVLQNVAKKDRIDHAIVSHWHLDHYGNHASLAAKTTIGQFWDRGIPDTLEEDAQFGERIAKYRAASQNQSRTLKAGDAFPLKSTALLLTVKVATASGDVIPNAGPANPFAARHQPQDEDRSDNAKSISLLWEFGKFRFLCCGDLTWNTEAKLMSPNNPIGKVDLFMVTHHGLPNSNNPALVLAIDPVVSIMCNGPKKGGHPQTLATLKEVKSLQAQYQLHRNVGLDRDKQPPAEYIANDDDAATCTGRWIRASVVASGLRYEVQVGPDGEPRSFDVR